MTLPIERSRSIRNVREFLYSLMDRSKTPRVPMKIRMLARQVLKHFPSDFEIEQSAEKLKSIWGSIKNERKDSSDE